MCRADRQAKQDYCYVLAAFLFTVSGIFTNIAVASRLTKIDSSNSLFDVIRYQSASDLEEILRNKNPDLSIRNEYGLSLLAYTMLYDKFEQARLLVRYGAPVDYYEKEDSTPLAIALTCSTSEALEMVKLLIVNGANPNQRTPAGVPLLLNVYRSKVIRDENKRDAMIKALIERGAELAPNMTDIPERYYNFAQKHALSLKESLCEMERAHNTPRAITRMIGDFAGITKEALPKNPCYSAWLAQINRSLGEVNVSRSVKRRRL